MRRLLVLLAAAAAVFALVRLLSRRAASTDAGAPDVATADPRAEELRRKLAEARAVVDEQEADAVAEIPVDEAQPGPPNVDERRRLVHEQGRAIAERMRGGGETP